MWLPLLIVGLIGYGLGSLPFGYVIARLHGINIFEHGSRNPGATNVRRVLGEKFGKKGKRAGTLVFVLDAFKGALAASWALLSHTESSVELLGADSWLGADVIIAGNSWMLLGIAGLVGALLGHSFSCFTKFKGGKGVATAAGGFLVFGTLAVLPAAVVWIVTFYTSRYVSLASILAAVALPLAAWLVGLPLSVTVVAAVIGAIVIIRHRSNIVRLMNGTENKFARKPKQSPQS